jgi:adenosylcobyric acid synthase
MIAPAIMVLGTGSHVGKSLLTAGLCRNFARQGIRVAPFKAQNMSLNSAATIEGLEIGRAQALQAEAAGIPPSVHMNPILLKPSGRGTSQVVVRGKIWDRLSASDYFQRRIVELFPVVRESYDLLAAQYELIILEGAGSPAEINLKESDIVNMRMAEAVDARCMLVADIDRGGAFASLVGTLELLEPAHRNLIYGFVINKFRGDLSLLMPGITEIEKRIGKPCLGVVPYVRNLKLDEEDGLGLKEESNDSWNQNHSSSRRLRVAIVRLPSIANFTDFDPLLAEPSVSVYFCSDPEELAVADVVVIPGSKQTVEDLRWMRSRGLADVVSSRANDRLTVGICGGLQMIGVAIHDPQGIETEGSEQGLGMLRIETVMNGEKTTVEAVGKLVRSQLFGTPISNSTLRGYEIHVGETIYLSGASPFASITRNSSDGSSVADGCVSDNQLTLGTYLHGIFQEDEFRHGFLRCARKFYGLDPAGNLIPWKKIREAELDRFSAAVASAIDLQAILGWVGMAKDQTIHQSV